MKKAFNVAATVVGANLTALSGAALVGGFMGCGDGAIGACINPLAATHMPIGLALTCAFAAAGIGIFKYGYSHLRTVETQSPAPKI